jgi:glycosyltransferase involved in cell wall biosynthesis
MAKSIHAAGSADVSFTGWIDTGERARLLAATDVVVVPSIWPEPYGLSGLEALAAGLPVAAFRSGGIPEWLRDGVTGALAPTPPTASGLADAIVRCVRLGRHEPQTAGAIEEQQRDHIDALESNLKEAGAPRLAVS